MFRNLLIVKYSVLFGVIKVESHLLGLAHLGTLAHGPVAVILLGQGQ